MSRNDTADSVLGVLQRPPSQRNLIAGTTTDRIDGLTPDGAEGLTPDSVEQIAGWAEAEVEARPEVEAGTEVEASREGAVGLQVEGGTGTAGHLGDDLISDELRENDLLVDDLLADELLSEELPPVDVAGQPTGGQPTGGQPTGGPGTALTSDTAPTAGEQLARQIEADPEESAPRVDPRLIALAEMTSTDPRHGALRRTVIEAHLPLVHHLAQRFRGRGEPYDDLVQVGTIGLLHAVDRYNPTRGSFAAFAVPTIVGEIRRHFRDRGWALRIPRRVQDLGRRVSEARETLTHNLDRSPTVHELAAYLQVDADLVLEALETASAYITVPLPITADESDRMTKAFEDSALELVEQRETLRPLLARLPVRQQRILELRFARGMSQSQIASEIGVSQMHVSRLLAKSLASLRSELTEEL